MTYKIVVGCDCSYRHIKDEIPDIVKRLDKYGCVYTPYGFETERCSIKYLQTTNTKCWEGLSFDYYFNPPYWLPIPDNATTNEWYTSQSLISTIVYVEETEKTFGKIKRKEEVRDKTYTIEEASSILGISTSSLYELKNSFREKSECNRPPMIVKVIFDDPATIVFWSDGTKTVVKTQAGDDFDKEKGLAMAVAKKTLGTNYSGSNYYDVFKQWIPQEDSILSGVTCNEAFEIFKNRMARLGNANR